MGVDLVAGEGEVDCGCFCRLIRVLAGGAVGVDLVAEADVDGGWVLAGVDLVAAFCGLVIENHLHPPIYNHCVIMPLITMLHGLLSYSLSGSYLDSKWGGGGCHCQ